MSKSSTEDKTLVGSSYAEIKDLSWMQGSWRAEAFDGICEEIWSAPEGHAMMGMFRLIKDGDITFYELMIIREVDKSLVLQLKHFNKDLTGWEEKGKTVDFPMVKMMDNKVVFDGYTIEKTTDDIMTVVVVINAEKQPEGMKFVYHRI
jgi:hypothetical protein